MLGGSHDDVTASRRSATGGNMTQASEIQIARMRGEVDVIEKRIDRAWEGIKADLARQEWLRQQIIKASTYTPNTDFITQEATRNLWHMKKYLDSYVAHLQGFSSEEEFDEIAVSFIKKKNHFSVEEIKMSGLYLKSLLPDIELDDLAMLLNIDFTELTSIIVDGKAATMHRVTLSATATKEGNGAEGHT